jgi:hypothetical protein
LKSNANAIRTGDFVVCRSSYHREQLGLPEEPGLVIEVKRSNYKVLYANDKRGWIGRDILARVKPSGDTPWKSEPLGVLHYLLRRVNAHECEFDNSGGRCRLSARIDRIDAPAIDEIRSYLGADFVTLDVVPEGMVFMQVEIVWRIQTAAAAP